MVENYVVNVNRAWRANLKLNSLTYYKTMFCVTINYDIIAYIQCPNSNNKFFANIKSKKSSQYVQKNIITDS